MPNKTKVTSRQMVFMLLLLIYSTAEFILPKDSYKYAKQDFWLSFVLLGIYGIGIAYIIVKLASRFKNKTVIEYSKIILGNKIGSVIGFIYCIYFLQIDSTIIREFGDLLAGPFYPTTPVWFFCTTIVAASAYALYKGLEVIGRASDVVFPLYLIGILMFPLANVVNMDLSNLKPVLAEGIGPVFRGAYTGTIWFAETAVLLILFPTLKKPKEGFKVASIAIVALTLILVLSAISLIGVFGNELKYIVNPYLELARYIRLSDSFERPESYLLFIWSSSLVIKIAVFYYCAVISIAQLFNIKDHKKLIIPVGIILVVLSQITFRNAADLATIITKYLIIPYFIVQDLIPAILLIVAKVRKLGYQNGEQNGD